MVICFALAGCGAGGKFVPTDQPGTMLTAPTPADTTTGKGGATLSPPSTSAPREPACVPRFEQSTVALDGGVSSEIIMSVDDVNGDGLTDLITYANISDKGEIRIYTKNNIGDYSIVTKITSLKLAHISSSLPDSASFKVYNPINRYQFLNHLDEPEWKVVVAGNFFNHVNEKGMKDLFLYSRQGISGGFAEQGYVLEWDADLKAYNPRPRFSILKNLKIGDNTVNHHEDLFPFMASIEPIFAGNFVGGSYDGVLFHGPDIADELNCDPEKHIGAPMAACANMFLLQFHTPQGEPELILQKTLVAEDQKPFYRLSKGILFYSDQRKGLDILAHQRCRPDLSGACGYFNSDGLALLDGAGGALSYMNKTSAPSASPLEQLSLVLMAPHLTIPGNKYATEWKSPLEDSSVYSLALGDANGDGLDDVWAIFHGDTQSDTRLCVLINHGNKFSSTCHESLKWPGFPKHAQYFVSDFHGDRIPDLLVYDPAASDHKLFILNTVCGEEEERPAYLSDEEGADDTPSGY